MATDPQPAASKKYIPAIILGSLVIVVLASTLLFRAAVKGNIDLPALLGTKNNGVLIRPPLAIAGLPLSLGDGQSFDFAKQPKHWRLLIPVTAHCDAQCQQTLYITRQIHIALGKYADRLQRYIITTQYPLDAEFQELLKQHPKLGVLQAQPADFGRFFARDELRPLQKHQYFVLDPEGWLMMYYDPTHNGKAVLKDLKFLLRNSHEDEGNS